MSGSENHIQAPRIAIRFGAPSASSSKSTGNRKPGHSQPSSSLGKRPRPQALGGESESEDDAFSGKLETVTTFGARGAQNDRQPRGTKSARTSSGPLVIACQNNRDWRENVKSKRPGKEVLPHEKEAQFNGQSKETEPADQDKGIKWGLTVTKKPVDTDKSPAEGEDPESTPKDATNATQEADGQRNTEGPVDVDQDALNALMGKDDGRKKKLVIAGASNTTEEDALKKDFQTAAEVSTLEEYDQIPDGEFGLAMLRGMGFDGKYQGSRSSEVKRKPALLGLGAKEDAEIKKAELAQKRGHRERAPRLDEYKKEKEKERRHRDSYKSEREREKGSHGDHSRRYDDRDRDSRRHRHGDSRRY
ncbi:DExH-box splicing factor binding site-domain-containing protein [Apiospora arundinis]